MNGSLNENQLVDKSNLGLKIGVALLALVMVFGFIETVRADHGSPKGVKINLRDSGLGVYPEEGECTNEEGVTGPNGEIPIDFALKMTGPLDGCLYIIPVTDSFDCDEETGRATFQETGYEVFVGSWDDGDPSTTRDEGTGTIRTTYVFEAKFINCTGEMEQVAGGCTHPFVAGSGTGVFENVKGRFDIVDNIVDGVAVDFPYSLKLQLKEKAS